MSILVNIILIVYAVFIVTMSSKISRFIYTSISLVLSAFAIIFSLYSYMNNKSFKSLLISILVCGLSIGLIIFTFYYTKYYHEYDFRGRVFSLKYLFSKKPKDAFRIIGRVLPYLESQLKYNGQYIESNDIATAGITLIQGSVGSGKTYAMKQYISQDLAAGRGVILGDFKGDPELFDETIEEAKSYGYDIYSIKAHGFGEYNFNYDPMKNLNPSAIIEALLNMRKWSLSGTDGHYKQSTQILLQKLVTKFSEAYKYDIENPPNKNTKPEIFEIWDKYVFNFKTKINNYGQEVPIVPHFKIGKKSYIESFYNFIKNYQYQREELDAWHNVVKSVEILMTSSIGNMFQFKEDNKELEISKIKNKKFLLIFSFPSSNKELGTSFTSLFVKDVLDSLTLNKPDKNVMLYLDEVSAIVNPFILKDILERGRSAKIATTLALQDINQIVIETNDAYLNSILGIINTFIIFNGATRTSAEKISGVQISNIETVLMNLRKPLYGKSSTGLYISKYPSLMSNSTSEVFRFEPYAFKRKEFTKETVTKDRYNKEIFKEVKDKEIQVDEEKQPELVDKVNNEQIVFNENENKDIQDVNYDDFI